MMLYPKTGVHSKKSKYLMMLFIYMPIVQDQLEPFILACWRGPSSFDCEHDCYNILSILKLNLYSPETDIDSLAEAVYVMSKIILKF